MKNTINIIKDLISIPSWVDTDINEQIIGDYIFNLLSKRSYLKVTKQQIDNERFNVIAIKGNRVDTLVTGHIDTVQPTTGWTKNPTGPELIGNRLYGLGTTDMKSGIAIMLNLACQQNLKNNVMFLFYCDEEYDFLGMKKFINNYKSKIKPNLIISLDGEGLRIGNSCRGLIELKVSVEGKAGHSANPKSGINAITQSVRVINNLKKWLKLYKTKELGNSTLNIAYINGGGSEGNIIAEKCEYIAEVRVADDKLNSDVVKKFIIQESEKLNLNVSDIKVRHNLGSWITKKTDLKKFIRLSPYKNLKKSNKSGYIDVQMLWEVFGKVPTFSLGVGEPGVAHKADEFVSVSNIIKAQNFYQKILTK